MRQNKPGKIDSVSGRKGWGTRPVLDLEQVLDDPQVKARELLKYVDHPGAAKPVPLADTAVRLSATPGGIRWRTAALGEHTDKVLREIGYKDDEIAELRRAEVV